MGTHKCKQEKAVATLQTEMARVGTSVSNLEGWQERQNGTLQRSEDKIDKLNRWIMGNMAALILLLVATLITMLNGG